MMVSTVEITSVEENMALWSPFGVPVTGACGPMAARSKHISSRPNQIKLPKGEWNLRYDQHEVIG